MKIILTGATGLIGSRFVELLSNKHEIMSLSSNEVDIVNDESVRSFFSDKTADVVIHLAAKTDVDKCEEDKANDEQFINQNNGQENIENVDLRGELPDTKSAFAVNFVGTKNLYNSAKERGIKFIYISTDFIFPGNGEYSEESTPGPINWYGMTKYYGEEIIDVSKDLIVRISFPYGYKNPIKQDFIWKLIDLLKTREEVGLIEDQTITPTFIDDVVNGIDFLLEKEEVGIFHLTGSSNEDPYRIGQKIKSLLGLDTTLKTTTREALYSGRAARPFQSIMKNVKIVSLGFEPKTFDQGLELITKG